MSDAGIIAALRESVTTGNLPNAPMLVDKQLLQLADNNNGNYTANIQWDSQPWQNETWQWSEVYAWIPMLISGSGYNANTPIAPRGSLLSFVNGIRVAEMVSSTELINEQNMLYYFNQWRLLTERTLEWYHTEGPELMVSLPDIQYTGSDIISGGIYNTTFGVNCNVYNPIPAAQFYVAATSGGSPTTDTQNLGTTPTGFPFAAGFIAQSGAGVTVSFSNKNNAYNRGFENAVREFKTRFPWNGSTGFAGFWTSKMKYLHSVFEDVFSAPMKNLRLLIQFITANNVQGQFPWLVTGVGVNAPVTTIGLAGNPTTRLYGQRLQFPTPVYLEWAAAVKAGYYYSRQYRRTYLPTTPGLINNSVTGGLQFQLHPGLASCIAVLFMAPPTGWQSGTNSQFMNGFPTPPTTAQLTNINVQVDNANYISQGINSTREQWEYIQEAFPKYFMSNGYTSLFNEQMFLTYMSYIYVNIARQRGGKSHLAPRSITIQFTRTDSQGAVDYLPILIGVNTLALTFNEERTVCTSIPAAV